jgi:hypothetical protein
MTQPTTAQVRRWQLVALTAVALLVGYIAGQSSPVAGAQQGVTRVQLDTSNCQTFTTVNLGGTPRGTIITASYVDAQGRPTLLYSSCN